MDYHYTSEFARHFEPLLRWLHQSGFFNFYVYLPVMTIPATVLFIWIFARVRRHHSLRSPNRILRFFWHAIYYSISWIAINSIAVGFKTMIVEEVVYQERKWFEPYLPAIHFYIASAGLIYLAIVAKSKLNYSDLLLALYVQVALIAGYAVAGYRALNEDFEGAIGGVILLGFFVVCNYDLLMRVRRHLSMGLGVPRVGARLNPEEG